MKFGNGEVYLLCKLKIHCLAWKVCLPTAKSALRYTIHTSFCRIEEYTKPKQNTYVLYRFYYSMSIVFKRITFNFVAD